jgi:hypothetical protein
MREPGDARGLNATRVDQILTFLSRQTPHRVRAADGLAIWLVDGGEVAAHMCNKAEASS